MRTIELLGKKFCVRFDTDKAPATVDANGKALKPRAIKRRGVSCTMYEGDVFDDAKKVAFGRAECNHRDGDVFNGTIGEKRSFGTAIDSLAKKLLKPIKARLENEVLSTNIGKRLAQAKAQTAPVAVQKDSTVVITGSVSSKPKSKAPAKPKAPAKR